MKDIELRRWTVRHAAAHSRLGQRVRLRALRAQVDDLLRQAQGLRTLSDAQLRDAAQEIRQSAGRDRPPPSDAQVVPLVLEAIRRQTTFVLHPNQVMAAIAMASGQMVELATGEGKTLVTVLAASALALRGRRVHVFTANRYLAKRDGIYASPIMARLGVRAGWLEDDLPPPQRRSAYRADVLYATLAEIAFDWLRDRLAMRGGAMTTLVPRLDAAVVDEADMVMIDEARTPLILAAPTAHEPGELYRWAARIVEKMKPIEDYTSHGRGHVELTPESRRWFRGMDTDEAIQAKNAVLQTLRAALFFRPNVQYVVQDEKIVLVDEKTGRLMPSRRWPDGLYEAVTAREGLKVDNSQHTIAQVTVQQYLAQYESLCGCSGTMAEAFREMYCVYGVRSIRIPTHRPCIRRVFPPVAYATRPAQFRAVARHVKELREQGRPVLIGTTHIATSQRLSQVLREHGIPHELLTALEEEREAQIVAQAGARGGVMIATNMAGRGTDIKIDPEVAAAGGLHVISLQRHDSSRVDRQLVGRCARQGDPGSAQFILCLHDPLLGPHIAPLRRRFLTDRTRDGNPIRSRGLHRLWLRRQRACEALHLKTRIALVNRESMLQALYGKPDYLADDPPVRKAPAMA